MLTLPLHGAGVVAIALLALAELGRVQLAPAAAHDDNGNPTYTGPQKFGTPALTNVQAVAITGDFEANLTVGLGMRRDSWHRVFLLDSPTRVVIDIGH